MRKIVKLSLVAAALSMAFGAAQAAEVTLYGSVSTGFVYAKDKVADSESFSMESAWYGDSLWGITGTEDLGNGWKVAFNLTSDFDSDTGSLSDDPLFDKQAYVAIGNDLVTFAAGRFGGLASGTGDFTIMDAYDPLEASFGVGGMGLFASRDVTANNAIAALITPVEGLTIAVAASTGITTDSGTWSKNDHYYALGAQYEIGDFSVGATAEVIKYANNWATYSNTLSRDAYIFTIGASYDFGFIKPMIMYQHGQKSRGFQGELGLFSFVNDDDEEIAAFNVNVDSFLIGATAPLGNGTLMASVQYAKVKPKEAAVADGYSLSIDDGKAWVVGIGYVYDLSERTQIYAGATYAKGKDSLDDYSGDTLADLRGALNGYQFGIGIAHTF